MRTPPFDPVAGARPDDESPPVGDLERILTQLSDERGVDLRDYRRATIERGLRQRMHATGSLDAATYVARIDADASEIDRLLEAVAVPHTGFFRDPAVFEALGSVVIPRLRGDRHAQTGPLRAWSIGTATGEEAWSLAVVLAHACTPADLACFEILATDREPGALDRARAGVYPRATAGDVPRELRGRYFVDLDDRVIVVDALRACVRFARHDVTSAVLAPPEAVIAAFDLILLRNVLIYFDRRLQEKVVERLCGVLTPGAAVVLGHVETLPPSAVHAFTPFPGTSPTLRIYRYLG